MMSDLERLLEVQQIDTALDQLRHRLSHLPERARVAELDAQLAILDDERASVLGRLDTLARANEERDRDLAAVGSRRRELERKMASTSVPREAQGFSDELAVLNERQLAIEDLELEAMEEAETIEATATTRLAEADALRSELASVRTALTDAVAGIEAELRALGEARVATRAGIDPALLARYEQMRVRFGGVAVAHLERNRCGGCHMLLSASELERLRAQPADALVECEQCGRLLVR